MHVVPDEDGTPGVSRGRAPAASRRRLLLDAEMSEVAGSWAATEAGDLEPALPPMGVGGVVPCRRR